MIESLHISNYALIDAIDIDLHPGLNIITGETGAGKSIILGALSLILGGRADTRSVRHTDRKSIIEAAFSAPGNNALKRLCEEADIDFDASDGHIVLRREITATTGRSRAFVNDTPVTVARLGEIASLLVDIHSQHQNYQLTDPAFQLKVIDSLAGTEKLLDQHARHFEAFRAGVRRLKNAQATLARNRTDQEHLRTQLQQLEELNLQPGEYRQLEHQRDTLAHINEIKSDIASLISTLDSDGDTPGALPLLRAGAAGATAADRIIPAPEGERTIAQRLDDAAIDVADIVHTLRGIDSSLQADPRLLEQIQQRLSDIYSLQHRHNASTAEDLIALRNTLSERLAAIDSGSAHIQQLALEARRLQAIATETATQISAMRSTTAAQFARQLTDTAVPLGMNNLRVEIAVDPAPLSATGSDAIDFRFAFNKNQTPAPVGAGASGGEISRLMLAIKSIIASSVSLPSIIFDEIDTGVSGDIANRMGGMMRKMAASLQVITITHLPTVAARGHHHYKVYKTDDDQSTVTRICHLDTDAKRQREIALMLSGKPDDPSALAAAKSLLEN